MPARTIAVARDEGARTFLIAPLLDAAIREAQVRRKVGGVRVQLSVDPPSLRACGDPERIHELVASLLESAIRRSPGGGRVAIGAFAPDDAVVELSVVDEGSGIPAGEADLHGGSIRAEQRRPRGCRMVVALPRTLS